MDEQNLYRAPDANLLSEPVASAFGRATPLMLEELHKTRPWVYFFAILGLIGAAAMLLVMMVMAVSLAFVDTATDDAPPAILMVVIGLVTAAVYGLPSVLLLRYGMALGQLKLDEGLGVVEVALARQRAFWRTTGIVMLAFMGLYLVFIVIAMFFGMMGALGN